MQLLHITIVFRNPCVIKGLRDGDIIQELLQVKDLTLDQAITKCRSLEAAKKSRMDIQSSLELNVVQTKPSGDTCIGCGYQPHEGGWKNCPAYKLTCHHCAFQTLELTFAQQALNLSTHLVSTWTT